MSTVLLTGASGTLGSALDPRLREAGYQVRKASRSPPADETEEEWITVDLTDGTGIDAAVDGVETVIHTATAPQGDTEAVDIEGTKRLLDAAADAGVEHFLYPSIVGIDSIPYSYYEYKLTAEQVVESSAVPSTIVRATQFYEFLDDVLGSLSWIPVWALPTELQFQPIAVADVADIIVEHAGTDGAGRVDPIGGPQIHTLGELLRAYRTATGTWRPVVRLPIPGETMSSFRAGEALCPDHRAGRISWEAWLEQRYSSGKERETQTDQTTSRS